MNAEHSHVAGRLKDSLQFSRRVYWYAVRTAVSIIPRITYFLFPDLFVVHKDYFKEKKIIVIGPAKTVVEEMKDVNLASFDLIVRMNRAIEVPLRIGQQEFWNIDILFYNLKETGDRPAGRLTKDKLVRSKVRIVIAPIGGAANASKLLSASLRYKFRGIRSQVLMMPEDSYARIRRMLNGFSPTTGFAALAFFLECDFDCLHIIGFTFFQTKYVEGYNDSLTHDSEGYAWAQRRNIHDPKAEAALFSEMASQGIRQGREITLGKHVAQSLLNVQGEEV